MQFIASGTMRALLIVCVYIPLFLALVSIFSTQIDPDVQSQLVAGMPLFLWVWLSVSVSICGLLMWLGSRLSYEDYEDSDFVVDNLARSQSTAKPVGVHYD